MPLARLRDTAALGTPLYEVSTTSVTGWSDTAESYNAIISRKEDVWNSWLGTTTSITNTTTGWPAGWLQIDTGTSATSDTITIQTTGNTAAANAIWGLESWQDCKHSNRTSWTPRIYKTTPKTPEELAREAATREQRRQEQIRRTARRNRFKEAANRRARSLLTQMLNQEQRKELDDKNHFHLTVHSRDGSMKVYRIDYGYAGNVKLLGPSGDPIKSYCIHADSRLPYEDQMLAQKLLLEADEKKFLRIANMTRLRAA